MFMNFRIVRQASAVADMGVETVQRLRQILASAETPHARAELGEALLVAAYMMRAAVALELGLIRQSRSDRASANSRRDVRSIVIPPGTSKH